MKTFDRTATVFGRNADYGGNSESESFNTRHEAAEQQQVDVQDKQIASTGVAMPRYVVLDMSICPFIDNDGIHAITSLLKNLSLLNIRLLLGRCTGKKLIIIVGMLSVSGMHSVMVVNFYIFFTIIM